MGLLNIPRIPRGASLEQAVNIYNMAIEEMEHRINGFLQSSNIQEIGGYFVNKTELKHKDGDVGLSSEDTEEDDVRFWAGGTDKETAPWKVRKSGKMEATGAEIQSSSGYPRYVLDPTTGTITFSFNEFETIEIHASLDGSHPSIVHKSTATADQGNSSLIDGSYNFFTVPGTDMSVFSGGDLWLKALNFVKFQSWTKLLNDASGRDLQTELDDLITSISDLSTSIDALTAALANKATLGSQTSTDGSHNHGIPDGTVLMVNGGGTVTFSQSGSHSHTQT